MTLLEPLATKPHYLSFATTIFLLSIAFQLNAQKANLDKKNTRINYTQLPSEPILDKGKRTYSYTTNIGSKYMDLRKTPQVVGFTEVESSPTLDITLSIYEVILENVEVKETEKVTKDKEGNVTSRTKYYRPIFTYTTSGKCTVINKEGQDKNISLGKSKNTYKAKKYDNQKDALKFIRNNQYSLKQTFYRNFSESSYFYITEVINDTYGYPLKSESVRFYVIGAKKHPEHGGSQKVFREINKLFLGIEATHFAEDLASKTTSIVNYYEHVLKNYQDPKDKKQKKVKYAVLYNLSKLFYWLDIPEKSIKYAQMLIDNDVDKREGKNFIKDSKNLIERLERNQLKSRHIDISK